MFDVNSAGRVLVQVASAPQQAIHAAPDQTQAVDDLIEALRLARRAIVRSDNIELSRCAVAEIDAVMARHESD